MKNIFIAVAAVIILSTACQNQKKKEMRKNPFFTEWTTPYGVPPFNLIETSDYVPAYEEGMKRHKEEIEAIVTNPEAPTFENTIAALDGSGEFLRRVNSVFENLNETNTNPEMQKIAKEMAPRMSSHFDDIWLNEDLFERVKSVYDNQGQFNLNTEDSMLLVKTYKHFVRGGANLNAEDQKRFREINKQLSLLTVQFGENLLAETNDFKLVIDNEEDLSGLPESVRAAAAETAKSQGLDGKWVFTLQKPSLIPFITYSDRRDLREKLFTGYIERCNHNNEHDNKANVNKIVNLRLERANLLGYKTHADYVLDENMAKTPANVYELTGSLMDAALPVAKQEAANLQAMIDAEGGKFKLQPWDWWYYAEKLKKQKYDFNDEVLRPYFKLENVQQGLFDVLNKLYGITFVPADNLPVYYDGVEVYEVHDTDNSVLGVLYMDFYPRESKRVGAWMTTFRKQYKKDGKRIVPIVQVVFNFSKPTGDQPALLSFEEASTMFHEMGHAMHGMLSNCTNVTLSGTDVPRDFVELPSQIMENWAAEPQVLKMYARHYETNEPIPDKLIEKIKAAKHFNQGFEVTEFISASILDMDWHTITENKDYDVMAFEKQSLKNMHMIPQIVVRYRSPYFAHIFSGGYSAGYYSYAWAEVLDADAFEKFKEDGIFNRATANSFREKIFFQKAVRMIP